MPNVDEATLPMPTRPIPPLVGMPPPTPDPSRIQMLRELLTKYGPAFAHAASGALQNVQQSQGQPSPTTPAVVPPVGMQQSAPPALETKFDPMSMVGSLPQPHEVPVSQGTHTQPGSAEFLAKLDPQGAATYMGVQGITQFIQGQFEKKEQQQHTEAANASQALMSALESAKTTGDYRPAEHILENNEKLFNKVYKGWLQKAEEAKKPQKQKKADPEVEGFEKGLATYLGKGSASQPGAPSPPSTLTGKSGAKYFMPGAAPPQAIQQQDQSRIMQQQRQDPGGLAQRPPTPAEQIKLNEAAVQFAKFDNERKESENKLIESQMKIDAEIKKSGSVSQETQARLQILQTENVTAGIKRDTARLEGQIRIAKIKNGGQVPASFKTRWQAVTRVEEVLNKAISEKRGLTPEERNNLPALLVAAGLSTVAKDVPGSGVGGSFGQWLGFSQQPSDLLERIQPYKEVMEQRLSERPSWLGENGDSIVDSTDDEIVVKPEDMK